MSFNFIAAVTSRSDFGAQENKTKDNNKITTIKKDNNKIKARIQTEQKGVGQMGLGAGSPPVLPPPLPPAPQ